MQKTELTPEQLEQRGKNRNWKDETVTRIDGKGSISLANGHDAWVPDGALDKIRVGSTLRFYFPRANHFIGTVVGLDIDGIPYYYDESAEMFAKPA